MTLLNNKLPPPLVAFVFACLMYAIGYVTPLINISTVLKYAGIVVLFSTGALFCLCGVFEFRRANTTVNPLSPESASSLVTTGIYSITRNPMYVGFVLFLLAWSVFLSSVWSVACVLLYVCYIHRFQIFPEEQALEKIFGHSLSITKRP